MAEIEEYKGLDVLKEPVAGAGGAAISEDLRILADRAPFPGGEDAPTVGDDSPDFAPGSMWLQSASTGEQTLWICLDASAGAAVWKPVYERSSTELSLAGTDDVSIGGDLAVSENLAVHTDHFVVDANGKVGIGTDSPSEYLHMKSVGNMTLLVESTVGAPIIVMKGFNGSTYTTISSYSDDSTRIGHAYDASTNDIVIKNGNVGINSPQTNFVATVATELDVNGAITIREKSSDPANPAEGVSVLWMSDGTGSGDDGDILMKITAGGVTKTATLVDFSAI